ncbi:flagellin lysine-N-methylase [Paenibacillus kobensis]|uniref:flagellin lysine-N-methylase n=1 Tax=Paenibacillus kobensis TaxID=59841 RepID=UPI000FD7D01A|nr:flagellin lysine-N-methylase [Paenibacillus kobensis]
MMQQKTMLPQYMRQFACTGTACEDTCCRSWAIFIDKSTYKNYQKVSDSTLKKRLDQNVERVKVNASDQNYAIMKLNDQGACSFLTEEKMCGIQATLGESYLSTTCATYPRNINIVDDTIEVSASMSCPESARLALLNKDPMEFDVIESNNNYKAISSLVRTTASNTIEAHFWEIRIFVISLLQNRNYNLTDRMIILGLFCEKLEESISNEKFELISSLIEEYKVKIANNSFAPLLGQMPQAHHISMQLLSRMVELRSGKGQLNARYKALLDEVIQGFGLEKNDSEYILGRYKEGLELIFAPVLREQEYILENYIVNYVFEKLFLFKKGYSAFQQYIQLVSLLSLIKFHIIGRGLEDGEISPETCVSVIQILSRSLEHNEGYLKQLIGFVEDLKLNPLALMVILIKN